MADEKRLAFLITARDLASKEFKSVNGEIAKMEKTTKGAKTGLSGLMSTINPMAVGVGAAVVAVGALTNVMMAATKAAIADEESQNRLNASLRANIPNWDGNTDAIEANIKAKQRLGFSDEELRDSLTVLAGATNDVAKAQEIMNTAMDLARFKGIDLRTASEALIKVEGGAYRSLKQLGIKLKDNATSTEALAAVQKVARGQAKAYGETAAGAMDEAQIATDEMIESLGTKLVPIVRDAARAFTNLNDAAARSGGGGTLVDDLVEAWDQLQSLNPVAQLIEWGNAGLEASRATKEAMEEAAAAVNRNGGDIQGRMSGIEESYRDVAFEAIETEDDVRRSAKSMADHVRDWKDSVVADGEAVINDYYDPVMMRADLAATNAEINAQRMIIASSTATDAEIADAKRKLSELQRDQGGYLLELAAAGKSGSATFQAGYNDILTRMKTAQGAELAMLKELKRQLDLLIGKVYQAQAALINLRTTAPGYYSSEKDGWATGGYIPPGASGDVGEAGREHITMFPGGGAFVTPYSGNSSSGGGGVNIPLRASAPAGGGGVSEVHTHIYLDGRQIAESVDRHNFNKLQRAPVTAGRV